MKTHTAIRRAHGSRRELARILTDAGHPISRQAIQQWPEDVPVRWRDVLRVVKPTWFKPKPAQ